MAIVLPQLAPASEDRVSGAQVIDGSLKFDGSSNNRLDRTASSVGNQKTWTWSGWIKRNKLADEQVIFTAGASTGGTYWTALRLNSDDTLQLVNNSSNSTDINVNTTQKFRDISSWYHILLRVDITNATTNDRIDLYINGVKVDDFSTQTQPGTSVNTGINYNHIHAIGGEPARNLYYDTLQMSQVYLIDGLALGPGYFGYTDPLTNTWRPKKFRAEGTTLNDGTVWSSNVTGATNPTNGFNGSLSNTSYMVNTAGGTPMVLTASFKNVTSFRYYTGNSGAHDISFNGATTIRDAAATGWRTVSAPSSISSISWIHSNTAATAQVNAVEINGEILIDSTTTNLAFGTNGFYLPMDGNSPIGKDKSNTIYTNQINDGTTWSSSVSGPTSGSPYNIERAFDGDLTTYADHSGQNTTWTFTSTFTSVTSLRVYINDQGSTSGTVTTVGGSGTQTDTITPTFGPNWHTILLSTTGSTINSISFTRGGSGNPLSVYAIEVNGTVLVNGNSWTPVNFGGSNTIDKATGAKPILNTDGGGNIARVGVFGSEVSKNYTILGSSGGGVYRFEGITETNPPLSFVRGATYIFDYSATTNGHPLAFSTTDPDSSTTSYAGAANGVDEDTSSNVTKITVPHDAPDTLWYYCTSHSNMNNAITVTTDESKADPYASNCVLALPLVGSDDDVSGQVNNGSTTKAFAVNGDAAASSAQSNFYGGSYLFDGTGDYLSTSSGVSDFQFGTGDFTIESYVLKTANGANGYDGLCILGPGVGSGTAGYYFEVSASRGLYFTINTGVISSNTWVNDGRWHHVAVTRASGIVRIFLDGIVQASGSLATSVPTSGTAFNIGNEYNGTTQYSFNGYIQDFRVYKGVAKYTTTGFIPASTNPDILPDTPSGVSGSSKLTKITDGAVHFDGASDNLKVSDHNDLDFGTGAFTIECFLYMNSYGSSGSYPSFISKYTNSLSWILRARNTGKLIWYSSNGGGTNNESTTNPMTLKKWLHIAAVREGTGSNQMKVYVDGKLHLTVTDANDYNDSNDLCIGSQNTGNTNVIDGYVSNVRIVKGSAVYTSEFTPPTRTLTNVTDTKLLCCQSNATSGAAAISPQISGSINNGTVWSHQNSFNIAVAGTTETGSLAAVFNSTTGTTGAVDSFGFLNGAFDYTYTPNTAISYSSKVRVWTGFGGNVYLNDGSAVSTTSNNWTTLTTGSGSITSIRFTASGSGGWWSGLEIDDVMLVDPVNTNGNAAATTFNPFTTDINAVRGQETGYCTLNPLHNTNNDTFSDGNLKVVTNAGNFGVQLSTMATPLTGKWYAEVLISSSSGYDAISIVPSDAPLASNSWGQNIVNAVSYGGWNGSIFKNTSSFASGAGFTTNDIIGIAYDADNSTVVFYKNNVAQPIVTSVAAKQFFFASADYDNPSSGTYIWNFGQKPFKFPPPAGFQPLNGANVRPETMITRPDHYVGATTWTGENNTRSINIGMKPDFVWIKQRNGTYSHNLYDSVRGATKLINSNASGGEETFTNGLTAFNSNGFSLGNYVAVNANNETFVSWAWKAGGSGSQSFYKDDVGYASASDVGMNVGGQNDNAYNQDEIWSSRLTVSGGSGTANTGSGGFGGTDDNTNATYVNGANSGTNYTITLTPATPISFNDELIVRVEVTHGDAQLNGGDFVTGTNGFVTFKGPGTFTSITSRDNRGQFSGEFYSVRVDGELLVDTNITPANVPSIAATGSSVGTKQGFSIVKYTGNNTAGATVPHGLSQTPNFTMIKQTQNGGTPWDIYHSGYYVSGSKNYIRFDTGAAGYASDMFQTPTSSAMTLGGSGSMNNTVSYIMYCWHDVPGLQKFGDYLSQGGNDANFVELGFRPAILWIKSYVHVANTTSWCIFTDETDKSNPFHNPLYANNTAEEGKRGNNVNSGTFDIDLLSNGFKIRTNVGEINEGAAGGGSGDYYLYCAWAKAPAFNLYGAQSNAR